MATIELFGASEEVAGPIREALAAASKARSLRAPDAETPAPDTVLPPLADRAHMLMGFDADGAPVPVNPEAVGGVPGEDGADGASAYQVAVANGFVGTEAAWLLSIKGAKGDTGNTGAAGAKGDTGNTGAKGDKGDKGDTGTAGPAGSGNMDGPGTSTDNAIARFNGTTGQNVQNSAVTINDDGTITFVAAAAGFASLNIPHGTAPTTPTNGDVWTTSAGLYVRVNGVTVGPLGAGGGGGGGLTNFTESIGSTGINNTVFVVALSASPSSASADIALIPKDAGSIIAGMPDGTATGGNKRGSHAVDLQTNRSDPSQVASGNNSPVLVGGSGNKASANLTFVGGGDSNSSTSAWATVVGGTTNTASGMACFIGGGQQNASSGDYTTVSGGRSNTASGPYSSIGGGTNNSATGYESVIAGGTSNHADGQHSAVGGGFGNYSTGTGSMAFGYVSTASGNYSLAYGFYGNTRGISLAACRGGGADTRQDGSYSLSRTSTSVAAVELTATGANPAVGNRVVIPDNYAYKFRGQVLARSSGGDVSAWDIQGIIKRGTGAASTTLVGSPTITNVGADSGAAGWAVAITADTGSGSIKIEGTGAASTTVYWLAAITTLELNS